MSTAILCIGTELVRGEIENTNASWLCREVAALGGEVTTIETIGDDVALISACLLRLGKTHDVIVCTGGLGPTTDDVTTLAVAELLGRKLVRDEASERHLIERYASRGLPFTPSNQKQCDFPQGATVCPNDWGTAPGFSLGVERATAFFFPGVPREMKPMFERYVAPRLESPGEHIAQVRLRTFGAPESKVNDLLAGIEASHHVGIGYRAHFPEIDVKPMARRKTREEAESAARSAAAAIRERLGTLVYAEGDAELAESVGTLLREKGYRFGCAESCTGGLVSALVTEAPASDFFRGTVVCYANDVKSSLLGVDPALLEQHGAVSRPVVEAMAQGARRVLGCEVSLALSGIAGPSGGTEEKSVGLVHFAVATPDGVVTEERVFPADRKRVQRWAAFVGLNLVRLTLLGRPGR